MLFLGDMLKMNTGLQGSTLSGPRMTTGFGPFELPTRGLLQKGRDYSPPKVCLRKIFLENVLPLALQRRSNPTEEIAFLVVL